MLSAGAILVLNGCGGPSRDEYIGRADAVCADANARLAAAGRLPDIDVRFVRPDQLPAARAYLERVLPAFHDEAARLHALGDPSEGAETVHDLLSDTDQLVGRLDEADRAGGRGDATGFTSALLHALAWGGQAQEVAGQYGFHVCGKLPPLGQ